jgi:TerC family integral membrane protein
LPTFVWIGFLLFIVAIVLLDLGVFHRRAHVVSIPEAIGWTTIWFALAMLFNVAVFYMYSDGGLERPGLALEDLTGQEAALKFLGGYLTEKTLSIDNIFVIAMIFAYFCVPLAEQQRLLIWGVLGAIVLRGLMIGVGVELVENFSWAHYVFGMLLLGSAARMLTVRHDTFDPEKNFVVKVVRRFYPVSEDYDGNRFFTVVNGRRAITPLMLALILVETSDVLFAVDSIPAIFAITRDPFLIWTSNVFAILGLRSLYFALAGIMHRFRYVKTSLVFLLVFVGMKLLLAEVYEIPIVASLTVIVTILLVGIGASVLAGERDSAALLSPIADDRDTLMSVTLRQGRRVVILLVGSSVLLFGAILLLLPGPGLLTMGIGLAILSVEFVWARRWLARVRRRVAAAGRRIGRALGSATPPD